MERKMIMSSISEEALRAGGVTRASDLVMNPGRIV